MDDVLVSVVCFTYNHEEYIRDALDGFLIQKNCEYEIIIHDDASMDSTADIIREYESKYPNIIHAIYEKENQYNRMIELSFQIIQMQCRGKYVAICEGDDYWIDSHKLQIQIDYMEKHPECVLTAHDAMVIDQKKQEVKPMRSYESDGDITPDEIIMLYHGCLPTASLVFKRDAVEIDLNSFFTKAGGVGDYPLQLLLMTKGSIHYFSRIMSVYRFMHQGSWNQSMASNLKKNIIHAVQMIHFLKEFDKYSGRRYQESILNRIGRYEKYIFHLYQNEYSIEHFDKDCSEYNRETNMLYEEEFEGVKGLLSRTFHMQISDICRDIQNFVSKRRYIYIMGAGKIAGLMARQLEYKNINFEGFVVSDKQNNKTNKDEYLGKRVWELRDIAPNSDIGIIVGINLNLWTDVIETLNDVGIENYLISTLLRGYIEIETNW